MSHPKMSSSLFDEIFQLQNPAPELDVDPEDQDHHGLQASLVDGSSVQTEDLGATSLKKRAAIIDNDPKYMGKKTARKDLYSDDSDEFGMSAEEDHQSGLQTALSAASEESDIEEDSGEEGDSGSEEVEEGDETESSNSEEDSEAAGDEDVSLEKESPESASVKLPSTKSDDREKGKAVNEQLGLWDDLMRTRISLQKVVQACNRLPQLETWEHFAQDKEFRSQARDAHSTVRKVMAVLLDLQQLLQASEANKIEKADDESDEEITSESEGEEDSAMEKKKASSTATVKESLDEDDDEEEEESMDDEKEDVDEENEQMENKVALVKKSIGTLGKNKRKLDSNDVEETLVKRHTDFQEYRNSTLAKWDEKTRLIHGKIRAKNFAAFEMSVLQQIEQVLVNRERLVKRVHQSRSGARVLGRPDAEDEVEEKEMELDDDEDEIELRQQKKSVIPLDYEIIDDNDFYHVCLRDLLESKQSEELDPVVASKQRLEIQRLRNKHKRKVDTKASKGRKIRYHVKEKLKNYMTQFDKSTWSEQQKDDLFKAVFGGGQTSTSGGLQLKEKPTINIGL